MQKGSKIRLGLNFCGIYILDKTRVTNVLLCEEGNIQKRVSYPIINRQFTTKLLNEDNMCFCCDEWMYVLNSYRYQKNQDKLLRRVISGYKPMAWIHLWRDKTEFKAMAVRNNRLAVHECEDKDMLVVSRKGEISKAVNLEALLREYREMMTKGFGIHESDDEWIQVERAIEFLQDKCFEDFLGMRDEIASEDYWVQKYIAHHSSSKVLDLIASIIFSPDNSVLRKKLEDKFQNGMKSIRSPHGRIGTNVIISLLLGYPPDVVMLVLKQNHSSLC
jgi:hypothetical protein